MWAIPGEKLVACVYVTRSGDRVIFVMYHVCDILDDVLYVLVTGRGLGWASDDA